MLPVLTPTETARLDRLTGERGISVESLMERAGRAVAVEAAALTSGSYGRRAVVVCGKGNNGGDGLVAARHLGRWGMGVTALMTTPPAGLSGAAGSAFRRYSAEGGRWRALSTERIERELARAHVAVDAMFGTGFRGAPEGAAAAAIRSLNASPVPVVAVDIPSGVDGESGAVEGLAVEAAATVTFGVLKPGLLFYPGAEHAGEIRVVDIGFPPDLVRSDLWLVELEDARDLAPTRDPEAHKRSAGVLLVVAGSRGMTGAAALVAAAAYRAGAGLVTIAVPEGVVDVVQKLVAEATFLPLPETGDGTLSEKAWDAISERLDSAHALAIGPGLTTQAETAAVARRVVAESPVPVVVDADALNAFAEAPGELAERNSPAILTPHQGEFARLTGLAAREVAQDRVGHLRKAASELRSVVLLKGPRTLVAEPEGRVRVNPTGGRSLATAGTGDVLTGVIGAFLARGMEAADAAVLGAYVHGAAGDEAAARTGEGTVATDVAGDIPVALEELASQ